MSKPRLVMLVTNDKYEFPLSEPMSMVGLSRWLGMSDSAVSNYINRSYKHTQNKRKIVELNFDIEGDEDE